MVYDHVIRFCRLLHTFPKRKQNSKMGRKRSELSTAVKNIIIEMLKSGFTRRKIGVALKIPKSTVIDVCKKYLDTGSVENKKRSGRPSIVGERSYRKLERIVKVNRRSSLSDISSKFNEENVDNGSQRTISVICISMNSRDV